MEQVFGVILAGGSGTRLWPLSRQSQPKHLIPFQEQKTLLELTYQRLTQVVDPARCFIVTTLAQQEAIQKILPKTLLVTEPAARNTAAALFLACTEIVHQYPQATLVCVPADHCISNEHAFKKVLYSAVDYAQTHASIILLGLKPAYPSTDFGYIEPGNVIHPDTHTVLRFHEKPSKEQATMYIKNGFLWNTGIFCAQIAVFIEEFKKYAPEIVQAVHSFKEEKITKNYTELPSVSFDQAILEKSSRSVVLRADFEWSDVGTLEAFIAAKKAKESSIIVSNARNNLVHTIKKTVLVDVHDLCIIETEDLIFISQRTNAHTIKHIVAQITQAHNELL